jgi:tetratricopeptide (TPR) repeat protein
LSVLLAGALLYEPALRGPFLFDDFGLPFQLTAGVGPLGAWLSGARPVLMFTYWLNHQFSGSDTIGYHSVNLLIHLINTGLVFYVLSCVLTLAAWSSKRARAAALAGAAIFLAHPLATESVSYIAGRSESLAALFVLAAYAVFLKRREHGLRWRDAALILVLFALGVATKENAVALAGVMLLTDWVFPRASVRKLYLLMAPGALVAAALVAPALLHGGNAGFSIKEFTWYQYAFTQARAILTYARMAVFPIGQSIDHDFPISRTLLEHSAWLCVIVLAALVAAGLWARRSAPLFCFGLLMFFVWLAPTSSVIPIADPLVERRMYLPIIGLILVACEAASRLRLSSGTAWVAVASTVAVFSMLTWQRNQLWGHGEQLLIVAARQSVHNPRPVANLTEMLIANRRCQEALPWLERAGRLLPRSYVVEASWGRALECVGRREEALEHLNRAVSINPAWKLYELIGLLNGEMNRMEAAGAALRMAVTLEPRAASTHRSLALWYEAAHDSSAAAAEYRAALLLDPEDAAAKAGLARVQDPADPSP